MLEFLRIKNFQGLEDLTIPLAQPITVIVGETDRCKSASLRALRWLATNKPAGDSFIRHGQESASVKLKIDGRTVSRRKGRENLYLVDGERLAAFGAGVPDPVATLLNLADESFQRQHDPPFWFSLSPGQVSKELNRIIDLEAIDRTLANLAADSRRAKAAVEVSKDRLKAAEGERGSLAWVPEAGTDLDRLEGMEARLSENREKRPVLAVAIENGETLQSTAQNAGKSIVGGLTAVSLGERALETGERAGKLREIIVSIENYSQTITRLAGEIGGIEGELEKGTGGRCPICGNPIKKK